MVQIGCIWNILTNFIFCFFGTLAISNPMEIEVSLGPPWARPHKNIVRRGRINLYIKNEEGIVIWKSRVKDVQYIILNCASLSYDEMIKYCIETAVGTSQKWSNGSWCWGRSIQSHPHGQLTRVVALSWVCWKEICVHNDVPFPTVPQAGIESQYSHYKTQVVTTAPPINICNSIQ